eukprot:jgi/Chlat1/2024/Chrsp158S02303
MAMSCAGRGVLPLRCVSYRSMLCPACRPAASSRPSARPYGRSPQKLPGCDARRTLSVTRWPSVLFPLSKARASTATQTSDQPTADNEFEEDDDDDKFPQLLELETWELALDSKEYQPENIAALLAAATFLWRIVKAALFIAALTVKYASVAAVLLLLVILFL